MSGTSTVNVRLCVRQVNMIWRTLFTPNPVKAGTVMTRIRGVPIITEDQSRRTWSECCRTIIGHLRSDFDMFRHTPIILNTGDECRNRFQTITIATNRCRTTVCLIRREPVIADRKGHAIDWICHVTVVWYVPFYVSVKIALSGFMVCVLILLHLSVWLCQYRFD